MDDKNIKLFENKRVRTAWDEDKEEWYFSVVDVVGVLTDSPNPTDYLKKMRKRDEILGSYIGTKCPHVEMMTETGKKRKTLAGNTEQILRIIQSIPSHKAEPFKLWLAKVGVERINETVDPELAIDRALATYLKKGYSRDWVNQRLQAIQVRKELVNEWEDRGVKQGVEFAILTDEITKAWAGLSTRQYKDLKGLSRENLRDNMSMLELTLNQLAEVTTTEISRQEKPDTFEKNRDVAKRGGSVAGVARQAVEAQTGKSAITSKKAVDFAQLLADVIEYRVEEDKTVKTKKDK
ncbi:MAG: phage antirepressor protein [Candidatus Bathyarchaeota archaeon]|nr:phage antirepressor protein [Candidatus Termiticorpusculum sp.]